MKTFSLGNPCTLLLDGPQALSLRVVKKSNKDLYAVLREYFSNIDNISLCLSGGGDSQFVFLFLLENSIPFTAYSYRLKYGIDTVNASDVEIATSLCKQFGVKHVIVDIDYKDFLENSLEEFSKKYCCLSPQLCVHLKFIDIIKDTGNIVMGDDPPHFVFNKETDYVFLGVGIFAMASLLEGYTNFEQQNNIKIYKNHFYQTPEILYLSCKQNVNVVKEFNIFCEETKFRSETTLIRYKYAYYDSLLKQHKIFQPLSNYTGFETLVNYFACISGDMDEFDKRYRYPLLSNSEIAKYFRVESDLRNFDQLFFTNNKEHKSNWVPIQNKSKGSIQELLDDYKNLIIQNNAKSIKDYKLY